VWIACICGRVEQLPGCADAVGGDGRGWGTREQYQARGLAVGVYRSFFLGLREEGREEEEEKEEEEDSYMQVLVVLVDGWAG
jgi:hypothetical protein